MSSNDTPETGWTVTSAELWEMWPEAYRRRMPTTTGRIAQTGYFVRSPFDGISIGQLFDVVGQIMEVKTRLIPALLSKLSYDSLLRETLTELFALDPKSMETYLIMREIEK